MIKNEQLSSLFSVTDDETDYEEEKRKKNKSLLARAFVPQPKNKYNRNINTF